VAGGKGINFRRGFKNNLRSYCIRICHIVVSCFVKI
jgi:hypothetical protein